MSDLINRQNIKYHVQLEAMGNGQYEEVEVAYKNDIESLPSADKLTTDCTKFMEWLKAEVLDEENWELNAIANGEIICRKLKKMGWLDVEDGFYVDTRPTGDKEHLIDLIQEAVYDGEACAKLIDLVDRPTGEWIEDKYCDQHCICSNCGGSSGTQFDGVQLIPLKTKFCPNCGAYMRGDEL